MGGELNPLIPTHFGIRTNTIFFFLLGGLGNLIYNFFFSLFFHQKSENALSLSLSLSLSLLELCKRALISLMPMCSSFGILSLTEGRPRVNVMRQPLDPHAIAGSLWK